MRKNRIVMACMLFVACVGAGCATGALGTVGVARLVPDIIKEAGKSDASLSIEVLMPGATVKIGRANPHEGTSPHVVNTRDGNISVQGNK